MKKFFNKYQYHIVCAILTCAILSLGFFKFPNFLGRFVESCKDLAHSFVYAFCDLFELKSNILPTVNNYPDYTYLNLKSWLYSLLPTTTKPDIVGPSAFIPSKWESFKLKWALYWQEFISKRALFKYLYYVIVYSSWVITFLMFVVPLSIKGFKVFKKLYFKPQTSEEIKESKPLKLYRTFLRIVVFRVFNWLKNLVAFIREKETLYQCWILLALFYFNVFTILFEFIAFYVYFAITFDVISIYIQFYKLFLDLWAFFTFFPWWGYVIIALIVFSRLGRKVGFNRLRHNERRNRGFINEQGVVTYIYAEMGGNKTSMLTDMALSMEVQLRDDALKIILECDACFPNFPWLRFERELKQCYAHHVIYDKWSCIRWIRQKEKEFCENPCAENLYGYDINEYRCTYDNNLYEETIFEVLKDYALAYTIYTTESSLIVSNYSIRVDSLLEDLGNFPLWNTDFFDRDSRLIDSFSRHSHILDFDMIRLGNQIIKNNPNRYAFGWGVWVITEADKEFKNTLELQEVKGASDECNQKNDLTHVLFKMSRHACYIRHRNMVRICADMQRIENITANLRGIGQVALIDDSSEDSTVLPFYSPYRLFSPLLLKIKDWLDELYLNSRFLMTNTRLITSFFEFLRSKIARWNNRTLNLFGGKILKIEVQSGRMEGKVKNCKYYLSFKKGRSKRNGSDCMAGTFESRGEQNLVGLNDMKEYADYIATQDELLAQHSYTQAELEKYRGDIEMEKKTDIKAVEKLLSANVEGLALLKSKKITLTDEAVRGSKMLIKELCSSVAEWVDDVDVSPETDENN